MKYRKATDVLPDALLEEVLKYVDGGILYFPKRIAARKKWGEASGARSFYQARNDEIRERFRAGESLVELAERYNLAPETVRKIIYE